MGTYTPNKILLPNGLDEIGYRFGMKRFNNESLAHFRQRILQEARDPAGASEDQFIRSLNRQVGELDIPVFQIGLSLDIDNTPLAADAYIEVTSSYLRAYHNHAALELDFEISLVDRNAGYFLREIETEFNASSYFDLTVLTSDAGYIYWKSSNLRYGNTNKFVSGESLYPSRSNKLNNDLISNLKAQSFSLFQNEVSSVGAISNPGDYYIDYINGIVFTEDIAKGFVSYLYKDFPYTMFWQPVNVYPANDNDIDYRHKDTLISDVTGLEEHLLLNSEGAEVTNRILTIHPLGWGH